mgnify:CR=1 FL=1
MEDQVLLSLVINVFRKSLNSQCVLYALSIVVTEHTEWFWTFP